MPQFSYKHQPVDKIGREYNGNLLYLILNKMDQALQALNGLFGGATGSGGSTAAALATRVVVEWTANGLFIVDTSVDGGWIVTTACIIRAVRVYRVVAGSSGSTILDLKRNGVSLYSTVANRPTLPSTVTNVNARVPDVTSLAVGDVVTVDTVQIEAGNPMSWRLSLEAA